MRIDEEKLKDANIDAQWIKSAAHDMQFYVDRLALWETVSEMICLSDEERAHALNLADELRLSTNCLRQYIYATSFCMPKLSLKPETNSTLDDVPKEEG